MAVCRFPATRRFLTAPPVRSTSAAPVASRTLHAALFPSAHAEDDRRCATATNGPMQCREPIPQPLAPSPGFPPSLCFANGPPPSPSTSLPAPGARPSCLRCPGPPLAPPPLGFRGAHPSTIPRAPQTPQPASHRHLEAPAPGHPLPSPLEHRRRRFSAPPAAPLRRETTTGHLCEPRAPPKVARVPLSLFPCEAPTAGDPVRRKWRRPCSSVLRPGVSPKKKPKVQGAKRKNAMNSKQQILKILRNSKKNQKNANLNVLESLQQDLQLYLHAHIYFLFMF